ncbi:MAG: homocysteine S-methyltransferase family protein [Deltaproteobacteria bacterium]|nr:homocysteine S-methyltransferase family protein [Deltaproteobacteria bacterium]
MHNLIKALIKSGVVVTDGSWGTQLYACGLKPGENTDIWNLTHPGKVEEVARQYVDAGSLVILTNTFGANRFILNKFGLADKAGEINAAGVEISKKAA